MKKMDLQKGGENPSYLPILIAIVILSYIGWNNQDSLPIEVNKQNKEDRPVWTENSDPRGAEITFGGENFKEM